MAEQQTEFAKLIDGSVDNLKEHLADKDLGYVHSLIILFENTYQQLVSIKDQYISMAERESGRKQERLDLAIQRVYAELLKIEEKTTFLVQYEKDHNLSE